jgi:hypothetical protein
MALIIKTFLSVVITFFVFVMTQRYGQRQGWGLPVRDNDLSFRDRRECAAHAKSFRCYCNLELQLANGSPPLLLLGDYRANFNFNLIQPIISVTKGSCR